MIVVWSASRPLSPRTPYARIRSSGWTTSTPSGNDIPAFTWPFWNWIPIFSACAWIASLPITWPAFTAGMLSENISASRIRTGPRSRLSASVGV